MSKEELIELATIWFCYGVVVAISQFITFYVLYHLGWSFTSITTVLVAILFIFLLIYIYRVAFEDFEISKEATKVFFDETMRDLFRYNAILILINICCGLSLNNLIIGTVIFIITSILF